MSGKYLKILEFRHFVRHTVFTSDGEKSRNKVLKNYITVKVVIDIETRNTRNAFEEMGGFS